MARGQQPIPAHGEEHPGLAEQQNQAEDDEIDCRQTLLQLVLGSLVSAMDCSTDCVRKMFIASARCRPGCYPSRLRVKLMPQ